MINNLTYAIMRKTMLVVLISGTVGGNLFAMQMQAPLAPVVTGPSTLSRVGQAGYTVAVYGIPLVVMALPHAVTTYNMWKLRRLGQQVEQVRQDVGLVGRAVAEVNNGVNAHRRETRAAFEAGARERSSILRRIGVLDASATVERSRLARQIDEAQLGIGNLQVQLTEGQTLTANQIAVLQDQMEKRFNAQTGVATDRHGEVIGRFDALEHQVGRLQTDFTVRGSQLDRIEGMLAQLLTDRVVNQAASSSSGRVLS